MALELKLPAHYEAHPIHPSSEIVSRTSLSLLQQTQLVSWPAGWFVLAERNQVQKRQTLLMPLQLALSETFAATAAVAAAAATQ